MKKKDYIEKLKNLIINKVRFHAPNLTTEQVDFELLEVVGLKRILPVFMFKKVLNGVFFKAFKEAKKCVKFNLVLTQIPLVSSKKVMRLDDTFVIKEEEMGSKLFYTLEGLNVNYISHSSFEKKLRESYIKIENKEISLQYSPYFLQRKLQLNGVIFEVKEFLLNGKNYYATFVNQHEKNEVLTMEFNLPLPRGYYVFKKGANCVEITNLTTKEKAFFNYHAKNIELCFSSIDGLESSSFACINFKCQIDLLPKEKKQIYFNYGNSKYCLTNPLQVETFFALSQKKMNEIFDVSVTTCDKKFDEQFNFCIPQNIWQKWEKLSVDEESENQWLKMRQKIVIKNEKGEQISQEFKGLKEVRLYRHSAWRRVFIVHNDAVYLYDGKTKFFNYTLLTKEIFSQNNEIYLSFVG